MLANGFYLSLQIIYHFFGDQTFLMRGNAQKEKSDDFHIFVLGENNGPDPLQGQFKRCFCLRGGRKSAMITKNGYQASAEKE